MKYNFNTIEAKWQKYWAEHTTFKADNHSEKPKYYVLDMFPYPSGAGLHVGHPLGYIASDIYARYKRHKGFNVLHPMGYDSFGLPAEQYAIQTGQHPAITTETNIKRYREQLDKIGFSFDWSREVRTSDPDYYKWTQWIFIQLFNAWYNLDLDKAEDVKTLISRFESEGNTNINASCDEDTPTFTAEEWNAFSDEQQQRILLKYRLTYLAETEVNWCPQLGTVLANDEVINGVSERGGYPVVRKKMTQWIMRISAYAERLLQGLDTIDWPDPLKEMQRHWIGKSTGAHVEFKVLSPALSNGKGDSNGYMTGNPETATVLLEKAKEMRAHPTEAEAALWQSLKGKKMGVKFRQQHLIDQFIVDFVCLDRKLIIEVDGEIHNFQKKQDQERQEILERLGYKVIRFKNEEVLSDHGTVLHKIENTLKNQPYLKEATNKQVLPSGKDLGWDQDSGWEIGVFTTRPDTIFGASFMVLAPEHELVPKITTEAQRSEVETYIEATAKRSERDRMADVKTISGVFTGAYALHPFSGAKIPIWIGDYVLAGYGTGAVMAVPCGDQRDYDFAKHFNIPIPNIFEGADISKEAFSDKENTIIANSDFLDGLNHKQATQKIIEELEAIGQGYGKINYRMRDAVFSRQRYWGEPIPIYYKNGIPYPIPEDCLPLQLPEVEKYLPTETGEPPLGRATTWHWDEKNRKVASPGPSKGGESVYSLELNTMPGWAGSSSYFNRYMDARNPDEFFSQEAINYWKDVDLYIGGSEHATGHLLYARFWQQFLYDKGLVPVKEFARKLINQGMILGESAFVYRVSCSSDGIVGYTGDMSEIAIKGYFHSSIYVSKSIAELIDNDELSLKDEKTYNHIRKLLKEQIKQTNARLSDDETKYGTSPDFLYTNKRRIDIKFVNSSNELNIHEFGDDEKYKEEFKDAIFIGENGEIIDETTSQGGGGAFLVSREPEKMSKSKYNVVNPDDICAQYGADTLRMYEMFLGPLEQAKPWSTAGITGVRSFLKKLWRLYHSGPDNSFYVSDSPPSAEALKSLHKTIKKVQEDIENFSFNTSVSTFMICVNELTTRKCNSRDILDPLAVLISPYAPHIAEELWEKLGHLESIVYAPFPKLEEKHLTESSKTYPVSFNGKTRFTMELSLELSKAEIEDAVMAHEKTQQQLQGKPPKKVIVVPGRIINIVV